MTATKVNSFLGWLVSKKPEAYGNKYFRKQIKKQDKQINNQTK